MQKIESYFMLYEIPFYISNKMAYAFDVEACAQMGERDNFSVNACMLLKRD